MTDWLRRHPLAAFLPLQALLYCWNLGLLSPWCDEAISLLDRLCEFDEQYGRHRTIQRSFRIPPAQQAEAMARVRAVPGARDLRPPADVVVIEHDRTRVVFRPSGTEPKLKLYAEVVDGDLDAVIRDAASSAGLEGIDLP